MPRHTTGQISDNHVYVPHDERRPTGGTRVARNLRDMWIIDNYRVRTWYYRAAPTVGDVVRYMDGTVTTITNITATRITLANSLTMRRPYQAARMWAWIQPRLPRLSLSGRGTANPTPATRYAMDQATLYV